LSVIKFGAAFYEIDTDGGQSGAPAYLMYGDGIILMGIHKGYSIDDKLNYCTMITKEVIGTLKKWVMKMKGSLKELNIKENISIKAKEITQV